MRNEFVFNTRSPKQLDMEMKKQMLNFQKWKCMGFRLLKIVSGGHTWYKTCSTSRRGFRDFVNKSSKKNAEVQPDLITYSTLLKGYCQVGHFGWLMVSLWVDGFWRWWKDVWLGRLGRLAYYTLVILRRPSLDFVQHAKKIINQRPFR